MTYRSALSSKILDAPINPQGDIVRLGIYRIQIASIPPLVAVIICMLHLVGQQAAEILLFKAIAIKGGPCMKT